MYMHSTQFTPSAQAQPRLHLPPTTTHLHSCSSSKPHYPQQALQNIISRPIFPLTEGDSDEDVSKTLSLPSKFPSLQVSLQQVSLCLLGEAHKNTRA